MLCYDEEEEYVPPTLKERRRGSETIFRGVRQNDAWNRPALE